MATKKMIPDRQEEILKEVQEIKVMLAERKHYDETVETLKEKVDGNGKPGFVAIRDKVLAWENKINAGIMLVVGDILVRIIQYFLEKQ